MCQEHLGRSFWSFRTAPISAASKHCQQRSAADRSVRVARLTVWLAPFVFDTFAMAEACAVTFGAFVVRHEQRRCVLRIVRHETRSATFEVSPTPGQGACRQVDTERGGSGSALL